MTAASAPVASAAASATATVGLVYPLVPYDSAQSHLLGIAFNQDVRMPVQLIANVANPVNGSAGVSLATRALVMLSQREHGRAVLRKCRERLLVVCRVAGSTSVPEQRGGMIEAAKYVARRRGISKR